MSAESLMTGFDVRSACRKGEFTGQTSGLATGFAQANLVVLPADWADEFLLFCQRNPKSCPLLEVLNAGDPLPHSTADDADLRTDLPKYRVWRDGKLTDEPAEISKLWQEDFVSFLIGCSFTFEGALQRAGVPVRHIDLGVNVPMFRTDIACRPAGRFHGPMTVSMRPLNPADAIRAVQITGRYPGVHGAPVHLGFPERIGIADLSRPDFGDPVPIHDGELPVFWACGVTPQTVLMQAKPPLAITHSPGCMFVTDVRDESLATG